MLYARGVIAAFASEDIFCIEEKVEWLVWAYWHLHFRMRAG